ncbi:MAG: response regulator [Acidobacteria bacterium]|nr:response regulator [Acidobacteriota bacterium]
MNNPPRLLLVDDRLDNLALLEAILAPEGYEVLTADSGAHALTLVASRQPDLILLDVMMPGLDGFQVCQTLRQRSNSRFIPVIMITALTELDDRIRGLEAGADDFISKPINDELLLAKIRSLLNLKKTRDELDELKHDFHNMIIHDLRAPVHSILGLVDLLREDLPITGQQQHLLDLIMRSAEKINNLISEFLDLGKLEQGRLKLNRQPLDLVSLARQAAGDFRPMAQRKRISLTVDAEQPELPLQADPERIDQVFSNLLQNALKFSPRGSTVTIRLERRGEVVRVSVSDQGPGLPPGELETIFRKYMQTALRDGGVGLGLYVCKTIVDAHHGRIWAENNTRGGATFIFELPVNQPDANT